MLRPYGCESGGGHRSEQRDTERSSDLLTRVEQRRRDSGVFAGHSANGQRHHADERCAIPSTDKNQRRKDVEVPTGRRDPEE